MNLDQADIQSYLLDRLNAEDQQAFELAMLEDPGLAAEVALQQELMEGLSIASLGSSSKQIRSPAPHNLKAIAASLLVGLGVGILATLPARAPSPSKAMAFSQEFQIESLRGKPPSPILVVHRERASLVRVDAATVGFAKELEVTLYKNEKVEFDLVVSSIDERFNFAIPMLAPGEYRLTMRGGDNLESYTLRVN